MPGNIMIDEPVPTVHMVHATIKSQLPISGQTVMDIALSVMFTKIKVITLGTGWFCLST